MAVVATALLAATAACGGSDSTGPAPPAEAEPTTTLEVDAMTDEELAAEAYVAGYPLVVSMRTLQRFAGLLGTNALTWQAALSTPRTRVIVAPNRDTLYSISVLDLRAEPVVLTLPEVPAERYFTYQLLDAWTESFAYVGTRTTGGRAGTWVITGPGWDGEPADLPEGAEVIEATTPLVFLLGRFLVEGDHDVGAVMAIRDEASLQPLSAATGAEPPPPPPGLGPAPGRPQDIPTDASFFDELAEAVATNPPATEAQRELFAAVEHRLADADPAVLAAGATAGERRITEAARQREAEGAEGGWSVRRDIGTYGDDLLLRAFVARVGWGANVPEEAVYPVAGRDADGELLDGAHAYRIAFPPGGLPPVDAFWSLTAYGPDLFFAEHEAQRWSVGDHAPGYVERADGSVEVVLSHEEPSEDDVVWLPVPEGRFSLMLRLYLPQQPILDGSYELPPIERVDR